MFANVIVAVDGRSHDIDAIALARRLAEPSGKLALVHVHHDPYKYGASQRLLERVGDRVQIGRDVVSITSPSVGDGLREVAQIRDADLLVLGCSRRGVVGRVLLGDDTHASLVKVACAAAVAPAGYANQPHLLTKIGVGYEDCVESTLAVDVAREVASDCNCEITALTVVETMGEIDRAQRSLENLEGVTGRVVCGAAGDELEKFTEEVDLLVLGSPSYGPFRRLMPGGPSKRLVRSSHCPLLLSARASTSAGLSSERSDAHRQARSSGVSS